MSKVTIAKAELIQAYDDVRNDNDTDTEWAIFTYDDNGTIKLGQKGAGYENFENLFKDDERAYGYVRFTMGDELSKRTKFVFINWCGKDVKPIRRAKMPIDKDRVKETIKNFAVEVTADDRKDLEEETIRTLLQNAGGANYGTGTRD